MRRHRSIKNNLIWGFTAQFFQYGATLMLLPILASRMNSSDLGLWFVYMTMQSLVFLLDLGFGTSLARSFAYIYAGATRLLSNGIQTENNQELNEHLLAVTLKTARSMYGLLAIVVLILLLTLGSLYVNRLGGLRNTDGKVAWILFCISVSTNIYLQWGMQLLIGSGKIIQNYKAIIILRGGFTLAALFALYIHPMLSSVSMAYLIAVLVTLAYLKANLTELINTRNLKGVKITEISSNFKILWFNSYRMGLVAAGAFMITKFSNLLVASYYGLEMSARYSITMQIFSAISAISIVPFNALLPKIAELRLNDNNEELKKLLSTGFVLTWSLAVAGILLALIFGQKMLMMIGSNTRLIDFPLLFLIGIMAFLELNHGASAMIILSSNNVPFVPAALLSGVAIVILSSIVAINSFPLWQIVIVQMVIQLSYNNWRWPQIVFREFDFIPADFISALIRLSKGRI